MGETAEERREWELGSALAVLRKIELIASNRPALCEMEEMKPGWHLPVAGAVY